MSVHKLRFGTCSWNYDSWVGTVYSEKRKYSAEYLPEYSGRYNTVEIDSWFYKIPAKEEVIIYRDSVDQDFKFTAKVPQSLTKPFLPGKSSNTPNPNFLSPEFFLSFIEAIELLLPKLSGLIFQFEYLNKSKMSSLDEFIDRMGLFASRLHGDIPIAFEIRNSNYLKAGYFTALKSLKITPVLVERVYMPAINQVYDNFNSYMENDLIFRLLGGDRKEIEELTKKKWNSIAAPKQNIREIAATIAVASSKMNVTVNVNNHYEGSGPASIDRIRKLIAN